MRARGYYYAVVLIRILDPRASRDSDRVRERARERSRLGLGSYRSTNGERIPSELSEQQHNKNNMRFMQRVKRRRVTRRATSQHNHQRDHGEPEASPPQMTSPPQTTACSCC